MKTKRKPFRGRFLEGYVNDNRQWQTDTIMNYILYSVTLDTITEAKPTQVRWVGHVYRKDEGNPAEN
jgi:hypothetical protein